MNPVNRLDPRGRFQSDTKRADYHQDLVMSPAFRSACESALCQYVVASLKGENQMDAMSAGFKLQGAKDVLNILLSLGDIKVPDPVAMPMNLTAV